MKPVLKALCLFFFLTAMLSCKKDEPIPTPQIVSPPPPPPPSPPVVQTLPDREFFFTHYWVSAGDDYKITVKPERLTAFAIAKGITVLVAIDSEISPWVTLPTKVYNIDLSYKAEIGYLHVIAKASFSLVGGASDIEIRY